MKKSYLCTRYDDTHDSFQLFLLTLCHQPMDRQTRGQRHVLPRQPPVAVVYGGVRHDRRIHLGCDLRQRAGYGDADRHDVPADVHGVHPRLRHRGLRTPTPILQAEPNHHLRLLRAAHRTEGLSDGGFVLPAVEDDGGGSPFLRGVLDSTTMPHGTVAQRSRKVGRGMALLRHGGGHGTADMALHA